MSNVVRIDARQRVEALANTTIEKIIEGLIDIRHGNALDVRDGEQLFQLLFTSWLVFIGNEAGKKVMLEQYDNILDFACENVRLHLKEGIKCP